MGQDSLTSDAYMMCVPHHLTTITYTTLFFTQTVLKFQTSDILNNLHDLLASTVQTFFFVATGRARRLNILPHQSRLSLLCLTQSTSALEVYEILLFTVSDLILYLAMEHTTLDSASKQIRLLRLHQGELEEELQCHFQTISLENTNVEYDALSYVWGEPTEGHVIYVDRQKKIITDNLCAL